LEGGLGAGKTFLVRKILENLAIKEEITSPTYTYVNEYNSNLGEIAHFDLYRIKNDQDFFAKGFNEIAENEDIACFVEWPSKISRTTQGCFIGKKYKIVIKFGIGVGMRTISFYEVN
jgi:tRNA threonylcarbamoyladenosine biosynthesis protein TsaE